MKHLITASTLFALLSLTPGSLAASQAELGDSEVRDAIEREVLLDRAVPSNRIDVTVDAGIATLTGSVGNILAKERAARIAETVKGVRAVVNRIEIASPEMKTDAQLEKEVTAALLSDPAADSYELDVTVRDGEVVLSGTVESWQERDLSALVAKGVDGVVGLTNNIQVAYTTDRPDAEILQEVEKALHWDVLVDHGLIDASVADGKVTLTGTVGSAAEKRQARSDAFVAGVVSVDDSKLEVARWARDADLRKNKYAFKSEEEIQEAVEDALAIDPRVFSFDVDSSVTMGVVTLRGVVDNLKAKRAAEQDARNTVGVTSVRNHLKVRPVEERNDETIEKDLRAALLRDPFVDRHEIAVNVYDGTAYLSGTVDSYFEKGQADDVASRIDGVTRVVNSLAVDDRPYAHDPYVDDWWMYGYPWYGHYTYSTFDDDWQIERDIEDELFWSPFVDEDEVTVTVEDGVATLTGTVDSWMERGAARDNALEGGATRVRNRLQVESAGSSESSSSQ